MSLLSIQDVVMGFRGPPLLERANLKIEQGQRVCLLGRNGTGKTTLLKLINGDLEPDLGEIVRKPGLRTALLTQEVPKDLRGTVFDEVTRGLGDRGRFLAEYHRLSVKLATEGGKALMSQLDRVGHTIEAEGGWQINQQVDNVISRMKLDPDVDVATLSVGMKRRVLLAKTLAGGPDILMLDEPTNHLDIEAICWLEQFLLRHVSTILFVTHDRMFLRKLATHIVELDRGSLTSWGCDYDTYLKRKEAVMEVESKQNALFDKKLAQEEAWIRQGIKARRTRNEGRVRALKRLRAQRSERREQTEMVRMQAQEIQQTGRRVIRAKNVSFAFDENHPIVSQFSAMIMRGDKVGLIGPNGAGKTTLLRILLGEIEPQTGTVKHGTHLKVAYFDQLHAQLDEEKTVEENVGEGSKTIQVNGRDKHVLGYLQDFLFTPERSRGPIKRLSGGERNRLLLAKLFTKPANVLVLDEPTNDLDAETLELLEELLLNYQGTVLLVSHDRDFLNNVVTSSLVFEGNGRVKEYAGGYDDWLNQRPEEMPVLEKKNRPKSGRSPVEKERRLTYQEKKDLGELPNLIVKLEARQEEIHALMAESSFYSQDSDIIAKKVAELKAVEEELRAAYERWETLEEFAG